MFEKQPKIKAALSGLALHYDTLEVSVFHRLNNLMDKTLQDIESLLGNIEVKSEYANVNVANEYVEYKNNNQYSSVPRNLTLYIQMAVVASVLDTQEGVLPGALMELLTKRRNQLAQSADILSQCTTLLKSISKRCEMEVKQGWK